MEISYEHIRFSYQPGVDILKNLNLKIRTGEKMALLGLNGSGKSTMLLMSNGLLLPTEGEIRIGGIKVEKKNLHEVRRMVGMVFQNADDQLFMSTIEEDVAFGPMNMGLERAEVEHRVTKALLTVGLEDLRKRNPAQLSGGQKRMASIATVLSMEPEIMVLDEPSANLDWKARGELINILKDFYGTCIIATHDLELAADLCERSCILSEGKIVADARTKDLLEDPESLHLIGKIR